MVIFPVSNWCGCKMLVIHMRPGPDTWPLVLTGHHEHIYVFVYAHEKLHGTETDD